jgi:solute carrier family 25 iron transporter 28/37
LFHFPELQKGFHIQTFYNYTYNTMSVEQSSDFDDDWEEWDGKSPFWHHCVAGSLAGVTEHGLVYPLDTVRTHIQVCAACHHNPSTSSNNIVGTQARSVLQKAATPSASSANIGVWRTMRHLMSQPLALERVGAAKSANTRQASAAGVSRLWRGVHTILVGCIPAHALYFSSYEIVKAATLDPRTGQVTAYGSALAGAVAAFSHDLILGPLDTVKQRLQLGHYRGMTHALSTMIANEGAVSLFRSFPVTVATNVPYGMVMVGTNEFLKERWTETGEKLSLEVTLAASSIAGLTAAALTTPLDRIKTYLQTQHLTPACFGSSSVPPEHCPLTSSKSSTTAKPIVADWKQAAIRIYQTEGSVGFFRGITPRILSHTPAVAISWTTYETAKEYLRINSE